MKPQQSILCSAIAPNQVKRKGCTPDRPKLHRTARIPYAELVGHSRENARDRVVVDDRCAELNVRCHDVARACGEEMDDIAVFPSRFDGAGLHLPADFVSFHDEAAAELVGTRLEGYAAALIGKDLAANSSVRGPWALQIDGPCGIGHCQTGHRSCSKKQ